MDKLGVLFFVAVCGTFASCSISHRVTYEDAEGSVPHAFFHDIKNNKTEKAWIVANLGEPHYSQQGPEQQEIYTYQLTRSFNKHGDILFFFRYNGAERETEYFHVLFDADLVKRHWMDDYAQVQAHKAFKEPAPEKTSMHAENTQVLHPATAPHSAGPQKAMPEKAMPQTDMSGSESTTTMPSPTPKPADYYVPQGSEFRI